MLMFTAVEGLPSWAYEVRAKLAKLIDEYPSKDMADRVAHYVVHDAIDVLIENKVKKPIPFFKEALCSLHDHIESRINDPEEEDVDLQVQCLKVVGQCMEFTEKLLTAFIDLNSPIESTQFEAEAFLSSVGIDI